MQANFDKFFLLKDRSIILLNIVLLLAAPSQSWQQQQPPHNSVTQNSSSSRQQQQQQFNDVRTQNSLVNGDSRYQSYHQGQRYDTSTLPSTHARQQYTDIARPVSYHDNSIWSYNTQGQSQQYNVNRRSAEYGFSTPPRPPQQPSQPAPLWSPPTLPWQDSPSSPVKVKDTSLRPISQVSCL